MHFCPFHAQFRLPKGNFKIAFANFIGHRHLQLRKYLVCETGGVVFVLPELQ